MIIKGIITEDFVNYKKPCMVIEFPFCTFKCEKECGSRVCQNGTLATAPNISVKISELIEIYLNNNITKAICMMGLEPMDSFNHLFNFIHELRKYTDDDIIIYTGYNKDEIQNKVNLLTNYCNIIIKFGRYIPNQQPHYDELLGIKLASDNQYAEKIS
jgi:hypothetical protein